MKLFAAAIGAILCAAVSHDGTAAEEWPQQVIACEACKIQYIKLWPTMSFEELQKIAYALGRVYVNTPPDDPSLPVIVHLVRLAHALALQKQSKATPLNE